jgi:hypothetical protein
MSNNHKSISSYVIEVVKVAGFASMVFLFETPANAQTAIEQQCYNAVQGKIAYDQAGNKSWSEANVRKLCQGTSNTNETTSCFQAEVSKHNDWNRGIESCKTGVVAVKNNGAYVLGLRVKWTSPQGVNKFEESKSAVGQTATIPLSAGARNIEIEGLAVGGKQIFKKSFSSVGMFAFTVGGTTFFPTIVDGLKPDLGNAIASGVKSESKKVETFVTGEKTPQGERSIKFNNQAGYVAEMIVVYNVNQSVGNGSLVPLPRTLSTPKITVGFTRPLIIPKDIALNQPIIVIIRGVGTVKKEIFSTTVPANFTGELCFKAYGTIFNPQGSKCN